MAVHQKLSEIGWFYHAPELPSRTEPLATGLTSQVPGLNDLSLLEPEPQKEQVFRDTDTKYIRLAKMGGRGDLLRHRENEGKEGGVAQPYPRVDWYYLEDNALEDADAKARSEWKFRLPEYMVHDEFKPNGDEFRPARLPYAYDAKSAYDRGERSKAIPEFKKFGYGVRQRKQLRFKDGSQRPAAQGPVNSDPREENSGRNPILPPLYNAVEKPMMSKIMSYGYQNEWQNVRDDWYSKTRAIGAAPSNEKRAKSQPAPLDGTGKSIPGKPIMYRDLMGARAKGQPLQNAQGAGEMEEKAPFKLSKFSKVPAKVTSHR